MSWLLFFPLVYHFFAINRLYKQQLEINDASSSIDVYLKNRRDTLSKLVDLTKSYVKYEGETLAAITKARNMNINNVSAQEADTVLNSAFSRLLAVAENYPNLKTDDLVQKTMEQATYIEQELAASRRLYNSKVTLYNKLLFIFPSVIVASYYGLSKFPLFVVSHDDREDVAVSFN